VYIVVNQQTIVDTSRSKKSKKSKDKGKGKGKGKGGDRQRMLPYGNFGGKLAWHEYMLVHFDWIILTMYCSLPVETGRHKTIYAPNLSLLSNVNNNQPVFNQAEIDESLPYCDETPAPTPMPTPPPKPDVTYIYVQDAKPLEVVQYVQHLENGAGQYIYYDINHHSSNNYHDSSHSRRSSKKKRRQRKLVQSTTTTTATGRKNAGHASVVTAAMGGESLPIMRRLKKHRRVR
jgi:hypothetical protein